VQENLPPLWSSANHRQRMNLMRLRAGDWQTISRPLANWAAGSAIRASLAGGKG